MKIAIPLADGRLSMHFGHCPAFGFYDVDEGRKAVTGKAVVAAPPHEPGVLPRWLHEQGATLVIAGGMGGRAQQLFASHGIDVVVGAPPEVADEIVAAYLAGTLRAGENACDH